MTRVDRARNDTLAPRKEVDLTGKTSSLADEIAAVCTRVGLDALTVDAEAKEIGRQSRSAQVGFLDALEAALHCLINPGSGKPGYDSAPWDYVTTLPSAFGLAPDAKEADIRDVVRDIVNQPGNTLYLLDPGDYEEDRARPKVFPPEYGETTDANWVFYMPLDPFASLHWVVVDKAGEQEAYCYGHD
jgi:hypothetical protein